MNVLTVLLLVVILVLVFTCFVQRYEIQQWSKVAEMGLETVKLYHQRVIELETKVAAMGSATKAPNTEFN